jgi:hypothetical protein
MSFECLFSKTLLPGCATATVADSPPLTPRALGGPGGEFVHTIGPNTEDEGESEYSVAIVGGCDGEFSVRESVAVSGAVSGGVSGGVIGGMSASLSEICQQISAVTADLDRDALLARISESRDNEVLDTGSSDEVWDTRNSDEVWDTILSRHSGITLETGRACRMTALRSPSFHFHVIVEHVEILQSTSTSWLVLHSQVRYGELVTTPPTMSRCPEILQIVSLTYRTLKPDSHYRTPN